MTRRNIDNASANSSPVGEENGMTSPPPPQASPAERSPMRVASDSPTLLATMTPVNVMDLKKEMEEESAMGRTPVYTQVKTEVLYDKEEELYAQGIPDKNDTPIDLIYEDGNKTVIYTTTPDQKGLEIYSADNSGEITINNISTHQIHGQQIADVLIDGNSGTMVSSSGETVGGSPGTVSVVLQGSGQGLLQYPQAQVPGTTVLVLSELVDDVGVPVVGLSRKRKDHIDTSSSQTSNGDLPVVGQRGMAELPEGATPPEDQQTWRAYYEHPLTAATTAMLNIGGGAEDQTATMGLIYEYYKLPSLPADSKDKLADIWPPSSQAGGILTSQLKATNGLVSGAGLELPTPPLSTGGQLSSQELQGLFINQHVGYAQPAATAGQNLQIVKREPEDLSHHRKLDCSSPSSGSLDGSIIISKQSRPKVVLVSAGGGNNQPGDLVVDVNSIKDESHRGLNSPQHGSRSINGTPTSTHSSLLADGSNTGPIEFISADGLKPGMYTTQIFASMNNAGHHGGSGTPSPIPYSDHVAQYTQSSMGGGGGGGGGSIGSGSAIYSTSGGRPSNSGAFSVSSDPYYREYFTTVASGAGTPEPVYSSQLRQGQIAYGEEAASGGATASFVERYVRQATYHGKGVIAAATAAGLTVDLPSPDSGIGTDAITPRDQNTLQQSFDYTELCQTNSTLLDPLSLSQRSNSSAQSPGSQPTSRSRPWHDFGRQNDADKIQIPKIFSPYGFKYHLESPISTSQRREDDRITYINKGQFYGITLEYIPDPDKQLKSQTVKSIVMLMFREEKSPEDEIKAWQFWHGRQHSVKQRILDADTKNSVGLVGCIEEVAHNAIAIYWNPMESPAKINIAVQCLSTDFSSQKGVKGLPLHLQIDTYEDPRDTSVYHRGYCQIKVFCDKGAERKTRDEERRAAKRKMTATGRKKLDELYHPMCERSEFYTMSDLNKPPVLFSPAEDIDKLTSMELQGFYSHDADGSLSGSVDHVKTGSPFLLHTASKPPTTPTLKFHNHFPPDADKKESILDNSLTTDGSMFSPPLKRAKLMGGAGSAGPPPLNERVMLYVRQENEEVYTPLHVVPPTTVGLLNAIENKYKICASSINNLYRKNKKGITAKIDDDMVAFYCNEDLFLLEVKAVDEDLYDITFVELTNH
ncbi:protein grainyhead isoform X2 [Cylas formicarius]|uniref:protein grainyhead isoform X2 n=1 Tax=Cylas formicarius TaxID=197179 RepID=UPI002958447A|nr:protein grainyhead isoform X2 [Cylas formicarius]